jgi:hypothetical protein
VRHGPTAESTGLDRILVPGSIAWGEDGPYAETTGLATVVYRDRWGRV